MASDKVCAHGSLARSCEICERDGEIAELKAEVERLKRPAPGAVRGWVNKSDYQILQRTHTKSYPLIIYMDGFNPADYIPVEVRPVEGE